MKAISPLRLVTLPVLALAVLPSCKRAADARMDPAWWSLEADRVELVQEIKLQKMRLGEGPGGEARDHAGVKAQVAQNAARLAELRADREALKSDISGLVASVEKLHAQWVADTRAAAVGKSYTWLEGKSGRRYEDVTITKVTDVGIEFRHSTGSARLAATELNPDLHAMFALDSVGAMAAIDQEREAAKAYEAWIDERLVAINAEKKEEERITAERDAERAVELAKVRSEARTASLAANTTENRGSRLYDAPRSFGNSYGSVWYPSSYYYGRNRYYYVNSDSCYPAGNLYSRYGGNYRNYVRAFAFSISNGSRGARITPEGFTSGVPARTPISTPGSGRTNSVTTIPTPRPAAPTTTVPVP